jgi:hypothetical protein
MDQKRWLISFKIHKMISCWLSTEFLPVFQKTAYRIGIREEKSGFIDLLNIKNGCAVDCFLEINGTQLWYSFYGVFVETPMQKELTNWRVVRKPESQKFQLA